MKLQNFTLVALFALAIFLAASKPASSGSQEVNLDKDNAVARAESKENSSVDEGALKDARTLRELLRQAEKMRVGSEADQDALSRAVRSLMMNCCATYSEAVREANRAGFDEIIDRTENYLKLPRFRLSISDDIEFDKVLTSEKTAIVWERPRDKSIASILHALIPKSRQKRITMYFNEQRLVEVRAVIHTEGL